MFDPGGKGPRIAYGGTYSGNPISMVAGHAAMVSLDRAAFARLDEMGGRIRARLNAVIKDVGVEGQVTGDGSLFRGLMTSAPLRSYRDTVVDPAASQRMSRLLLRLMDAGKSRTQM